MPDSSLAIRDHAIEVPGGKVFAREWARHDANGIPLVLLHDSLGCVDVWRDFPATLAAGTGRRVIAYDRLGFGRSEARTDTLSSSFVRQESERYLPHILQALQLEQFIPLGHSVGGGMAMYCGATLRQHCSAIITVAAQMFAEHRTLSAIAAAKEAYADPALFAKLQKYHGDKTGWVLRAWTDTWLSPEFREWSLRDTLPIIRCPVLALHGELDEFGSKQHPMMIEMLSGGRAQAVILSGIGHVPHREQPLTIVDLIGGFLGTLPD
jgi:pimeloyl-ACP methyl ester carboxylesterase